jgi:PAS domain S-box-containing protein
MNPEELEQKLYIAQQRIDLLSNHTNEFLLQPDLLTVVLEEVSASLDDLQQQQEHLVAAQQTLEAERCHYQELFNLAPEGYVVTSAQGIIREANRAASTLFNIRSKFLVGKPLVVFVAKSGRQAFQDQLSQLEGLCPVKHWEVTLHPRQREPFPAAIAVAAGYDSTGNLIHFRWLIRDITELRQAETRRNRVEAEQELREFKSRLIETVSHEFRTPLTIIRTSSELLEHYGTEVSEERRQQYFKKIRDAVRYVTQLIDEVLNFSRVESGELVLNPQSLDLVQFCRCLVDEMESAANAGQTIQFICDRQDYVVSLDQRQLQKILTNLLSNAFKYSPEQSIVEFKLSCLADQVVFRIHDPGIGIPVADQLNLFELFYRASNVSNRPGIGLGLAIVKKSVDLHGGTIAIDSAIGVGTTVTVTLPLIKKQRMGNESNPSADIANPRNS